MSAFELFHAGWPAPILTAPEDFDVVHVAVQHLACDVERVTGCKPELLTSPDTAAGPTIIAGTLGRSALIGTLVEQGKLDTAALAGLWESFL
ncbi:MAG TPA: hypothetical protein VMT24_05030, partial [Aggregatilineaceae bacterium]|nr:hypothetical protein [Aggregatilineaceae bacterium]